MIELPEYLQELIMPEPNSGCWLYFGNDPARNGYGRAWVNGKRRVLHRIVYELLVGPIPRGHILDHKCKIRPCCNPQHVEPVTDQVNTWRGGAVLYRRREAYA